MKTCLITGGLGYIGSHICIELLENNYNIIIIDNLSNSNIDKLEKIKKYNNLNNKIYFYNIDLIEYEKLDIIINLLINENNCKIDIIIHLAGLKAVSESIEQPIKYYQNNIISTLNLTKIMEKYNIKNLIFSSSSTVYGNEQAPYYENTQTGIGITNPYGRSKFIQEEILKDICIKNKDWNIILLRYFNPIGHLNIELKEVPNGIPNNLFPYLLKVHLGELKELIVFGSDYETRDGTCSRDFIHVVDLANAHKICCDSLLNNKIYRLKIYNVGTGKDTTVLELINAFEKINNTKLNYKFGSKRQGDLKSSYSNVDLIYNELEWKSKYLIEDCVKIN
jgi:UDP-glucose 4-epimerase